MTHAHDYRRLRTCHSVARVILFLAAIAFTSHDHAWGDDLSGLPPMPPVPEDARVDPAVQPAAFEIATPLPLDGSPGASAGAPAGRLKSSGPLGNWTVLAAIASAFVVLAGFRFWQKRAGSRDVPSDVFDVLGEASLGGQHAVRVVRFGPRTLLLGISNAGCQTLATLDDPQVTERIVKACLDARLPRPSRVPARAPHAVGGRGGREAQ